MKHSKRLVYKILTFVIFSSSLLFGQNLSFTPPALDFGSDATVTVLSAEMSNETNGTLNWTVDAQPAWANVTPAAGSLGSAATETLTITVNRSGLAAGAYSDTIRVTADGQTTLLAVDLNVSGSVTITNLSFSGNFTDQTFSISNDGNVSLEWTASTDTSWLVLSSTSGNVNAGSIADVTVSVDGNSLLPGSYNQEITVVAAGETSIINVAVVVASLVVSPTSLIFDSDTTISSADILIVNGGGGSVDWSANPSENWISTSANSGSVQGVPDTVEVFIDRSALAAGLSNGIVTIAAGSAGSVDVSVQVQVPELSISTTTLDFGSIDNQRSFTISNSPAGAGVLSWEVVSSPPWVQITPENGTTETDLVEVLLLRNMLDQPGDTSGTIEIQSNGGNASIDINVQVPELAFSPASLDFGDDLNALQLTIENSTSGTGDISWMISTETPWVIAINPSSGTTPDGLSGQVTVLIDRSLIAGAPSGNLTITSNALNNVVSVPMTVDQPVLNVSPGQLNFGNSEDTLEMVIANNGAGNLDWTVSDDQTWITEAIPASGNTAAGNNSVVQMIVDRSLVAPGMNYQGNVFVNSNGGEETILATMTVGDISIRPELLDFGINPVVLTKSLLVNNNGTTPLNWTITEGNQGWISNVSPQSGTLASADSVTLNINITTDALSFGQYQDVLTFSDGSNQWEIPVSVEIAEFLVSTDTLNFGSASSAQTFDIINESPSPLNWSVSADSAWVTLIPGFGNTPSMNSSQVQVAINRSVLSSGDNLATIDVNLGGSIRQLAVIVEMPEISLNTDNVIFNSDPDSNSATLEIANLGSGLLGWGVSEISSWLNLDTLSGTIDAGSTQTVLLSVARGALPPGTHFGQIQLASNGTQTSTIVQVSVQIADLGITTDLLNYGNSEDTLAFSLFNNGAGDLNANAEENQPWIIVNSDPQNTIFQVIVDRDQLQTPGSYNGAIDITSFGGDTTVTVLADVAGVAVSPQQLDFGTMNITDSFVIRNTGGGDLPWSVTHNQSWLSVFPESGLFNDNLDSVRITVNVDRSGLPAGAYSEALLVDAAGFDNFVSVKMGIEGRYFAQDTVSFGGDTLRNAVELAIHNDGNDTLSWTLSIDNMNTEWLTALPLSGNTPPGESSTTTLQANRSELPPGQYTAAVQLTSNAGNDTIPAFIDIAGLFLSAEGLDFGDSLDTLPLTIGNLGESGNFAWQISSTNNWISFNENEGTVQGADRETVLVSIDRSALSLGAIEGNVSVSSTGGSQTLIVQSIQTAPVVEHEPLDIVNVNADVQILASADDPIGIEEVTVFFRRAGDLNYFSSPMELVGNGNYSLNLLALAVTDRGLEYYFSARNNSGRTTILPENGNQQPFSARVRISGNGIQRTDAQTSGETESAYRLFSVPLDLDTKTAGAVLADDLGEYDPFNWRFYQLLANQSYRELSDADVQIVPGKAYWLLVKGGGRVIDTGPGVTNSTAVPYSIPLNSGWNFISNPYNFPVDIENARLGSDGAVQLLTYTGGWAQLLPDPSGGEILPFEGYAIFNNSQEVDQLFLDAHPAIIGSTAQLPKTRSNYTANWEMTILASNSVAEDGFNKLGFADIASAGLDSLDYPEPPVIGEYLSLYFPHPEWQAVAKKYTRDFQPLPSEGSYWDFEVLSGRAGDVQLTFTETGVLPEADFEFVLIDQLLQTTISLKEMSVYEFYSTGAAQARKFRLLVGNSDYVNQRMQEWALLPENFRLLQNFPNPFNPRTTIRFALPGSATVSLAIYNILGQKIATLLNEQNYTAGFHAIEWHGNNDNGQRAASGIYFYRISAGDFSATKRMLLIE